MIVRGDQLVLLLRLLGYVLSHATEGGKGYYLRKCPWNGPAVDVFSVERVTQILAEKNVDLQILCGRQSGPSHLTHLALETKGWPQVLWFLRQQPPEDLAQMRFNVAMWIFPNFLCQKEVCKEDEQVLKLIQTIVSGEITEEMLIKTEVAATA